MSQLNVIVDKKTEQLIREGAKSYGVSISHHLNNLIQRALTLDEQSKNVESILNQPQFEKAFKKLLIFSTENLALTRFLVECRTGGSGEDTTQEMLKMAKTHAEGLFE